MPSCRRECLDARAYRPRHGGQPIVAFIGMREAAIREAA